MSSGSMQMTDAKMRGREVDGSLEVLNLDLEQDYDLDLEDNGDYDMDNEEDLDEENTGRTSSIFRITDPLAKERKHATNPGQIAYDSNEDEDENYLASRQLALFEGESDEEVEVASDEEKDIVKAIREEITKLVAAEMKDELEIFNRPPAITACGEDSQTVRDDLIGIDPKLKEEIRKMRKLDRILERKMKQEKKVKRERIILEKQLRAELRSLLNEKKQISGDEKKNTEKFLALELPPSHNAGIHIDDDEIPDTMSSCCSPVFPTQPPEIVAGKRQTNAHRKASPAESNLTVQASNSRCNTIDDQKNANGNNCGTPSTTSSFAETSLMTKPTVAPSEGTSTKSKQSRADKPQKKKNFIKRNIQLACEAQNSVAMTDDERKRLNLLLADLDGSDSEQDNADEQKHDQNLEIEGGSWLDKEEKQRLEEIDGRLKMLLPAEDFESINSVTPSYILPEQPVSDNEMESRLEMLMENDFLGEKVLRDNKEQRDLKARLLEIDERLSRLASTPLALEAEMQTPKLSEEQLNSLLEECARTLYSAASNNIETEFVFDRSGASTKAIMYEHPMHLDPETLQQLLAEAQQPRSIQSTDRSTNSSRFVPRPPSSQRISRNSHSLDGNSNSEQRNLQSPLESLHTLDRNPPSPVDRDFISSPDHDAHPVDKYPFPPGQLFRKRSSKSSTNATSTSVSPPKPFLPEIDANACLVSRPASTQSRYGSDDLTSVHRPPSSNKV